MLVKNMFKNCIASLILTFILMNTAKATWCIGHRGYQSKYFQNSMSGFEAAIIDGIDGIEIDVRHTSDGTPIIIHDKTLKNVGINRDNKNCDLTTEISKQTITKIKENCLLKNGEEIPLFKDVMELSKNQKNLFLFIEVKDAPQPNFFKIYNNANFLVEKTRFISFKKKNLRMVKKNILNAKTLILSNTTPQFINHEGGNISQKIIFGLDKSIWLLFKLNKEVGVWTVNQPQKMEELFDQKIHFITTDAPDLCMQLKNNLYAINHN